MSHPKQRGKGRMAPGRGPRGGYNKFASSQNALPHNSSMLKAGLNTNIFDIVVTRPVDFKILPDKFCSPLVKADVSDFLERLQNTGPLWSTLSEGFEE